MEPPSVASVVVADCRALTAGGREATFTVTFDGGVRWTLIAEKGPVTRADDGSWNVVIDQSGPGTSVTLAHLLVGGGIPFRTAVLLVPAGSSATAAC